MGTWDLMVSFEVDTLPLEAMSSLKLLLPLFLFFGGVVWVGNHQNGGVNTRVPVSFALDV